MGTYALPRYNLDNYVVRNPWRGFALRKHPRRLVDHILYGGPDQASGGRLAIEHPWRAGHSWS
jgi:hypothetical protein